MHEKLTCRHRRVVKDCNFPSQHHHLGFLKKKIFLKIIANFKFKFFVSLTMSRFNIPGVIILHSIP